MIVPFRRAFHSNFKAKPPDPRCGVPVAELTGNELNQEFEAAFDLFADENFLTASVDGFGKHLQNAAEVDPEISGFIARFSWLIIKESEIFINKNT
jgi:hypothetical protein